MKTELLIHCNNCDSYVWYDIEKLPMIECPVCHKEAIKSVRLTNPAKDFTSTEGSDANEVERSKSDILKQYCKENNIPYVDHPSQGDKPDK